MSGEPSSGGGSSRAVETRLDEEAIWEWGVVERVSTGLLGTRVGLQPIAREMLDAADHVACMT